MSPGQGFIYGTIQGLTEILPISSSGHLVLLPWILGWTDPGLGFDVALHAGTLIAIVWYFRAEWIGIGSAAISEVVRSRRLVSAESLLLAKIALASIPGAIAGVFLVDLAETLFRSPLLVAANLAGFGVLLFLADRRTGTVRAAHEIGWTSAVVIGLAQAISLVPGVSRSGVTITTARFLGIDRETSARFSFLLAAPITAGAVLFEGSGLVRLFSNPGQLVAFAASMAFAFAAVAGLLQYVRGRSYTPFVIYRLVLAALIVAVAR